MNEEKHTVDVNTKAKMKAYDEKILSLKADNDTLKEKHYKALEYWQNEYSKLLSISQKIKEENVALKSKINDIHADLGRLMENIHT